MKCHSGFEQLVLRKILDVARVEPADGVSNWIPVFQDPLHLYSDASTIHIYLQDWEMVGVFPGVFHGSKICVVVSTKP